MTCVICEIGIVDDAGQVEGRAAVVAPEHHALEALRQPGGPRRLEVARRALALPDRALVPPDAEPAQIGEHPVLASGHVARRIRVVDAEQQPVAEPAICNGAERVPDVE